MVVIGVDDTELNTYSCN